MKEELKQVYAAIPILDYFPRIVFIQEKGRATTVIFSDKTKEKVVRDLSDPYDLTSALLYALAKKMYRNVYTWEGIEYMATKGLRFRKDVIKMIEKAIKNHKKLEQAIQDVEKNYPNLKEKEIKKLRKAREKSFQDAIRDFLKKGEF